MSPTKNPKDEPTSPNVLSYPERRRSLDGNSLNDLAPNGWFHHGRTDTPERTPSILNPSAYRTTKSSDQEQTRMGRPEIP
ncbi:unnamed protein product [Phytophthora fragariaefolia]|uniref:Unnamed protein product n=1 Tax=Phytophthora fragariaefolia TaxID=1490495 RepID=A0A9W6XPF5_9STRA|nr:unnamed protein product [Phytophthora fragariaefolia]